MTTTLDSLRASATAVPDQIRLYGAVEDASAALSNLSYSIMCREISRPSAPPSRIQIAKARVIARNLSRALEDFR